MQTTNIKAQFSKLLLSVEYCFYFVVFYCFSFGFTQQKISQFLLHLALTGTFVLENSLENLKVQKNIGKTFNIASELNFNEQWRKAECLE